MFKLLGPVEKRVVFTLLILLSVYFKLEEVDPAILNPELRNLSKTPSAFLNPSPREGHVVPVSVSGVFRSDLSRFFNNETENQAGGKDTQINEQAINYFATGTDGQAHPSNAYLLRFSPFYTSKYWLPLLAVSLRVRYMRDDENFKHPDVWQTSLETYLRRKGDCEDHAILLADWMINLGYDARVVVGTLHKEGHAWVVLNRDGNEYLLESTDKASNRRFPFVYLHPEYVAEYMFNRDYFWAMAAENKGWRNRLATPRWVELSIFEESFLN